MTRKLFAFQILILALCAGLFLLPRTAFATTCGTGSNVTFTDIGGGQCRAFLITSGNPGTLTVPTDWNSSNNTIETIGGGGSGGCGSGTPGGGGGGYSATTTVSLTQGGSVTYFVGAGGVGTPPPASCAETSGADTYFCNSTSNCASIAGTAVVAGAKGGTAGGTGAGQDGLGGAAASGVGGTKYTGGTGGTGISAGGSGGGGGAAGLAGNGATGGDGSATGGTNRSAGGGGGNGGGSNGAPGILDSNGGNGGNNSGATGHGNGGTAGANSTSGTNGGGGGGAYNGSPNAGATTGAGGAGTEWDASHGSGGGSGSCAQTACTVSAAGLYGAGGGGRQSGNGAQGIIVITYAPLIPPSVTTNAASLVSSISATLNGTISDTGSSNPTARGFAWGTNSTLSGGDTATTTESGSFGVGTFNNSLSPQNRNTTYYFRAYSTNSVGTGYGSITSFSTSLRRALLKPPNNLGLVGYWPFNEGTSTQAGDFSGNGHTGILTSGGGNFPKWTYGKRGSALLFNGANYVAASQTGFPIGSSGRTMSGWIYITGDDNNQNNLIWHYGACSVTGDGFGFVMDDQFSNPPILKFWACGGVYDINTNYALTLNTWHHLVEIYDGSNVSVYVDGAQVLAPTGDSLNTGTAFGLEVGGEAGASNGDDFIGRIDDLQLYNRALSASEVAKLYASGTAGAARANASTVTLQNGTTLGPANGLIGHWTFDGGDTPWSSATAGVAYDRSGNGNTGTLTSMNRSSAPTIGHLGQALNFDNSATTYVNTNAVANDVASGPFTVSLWFMATTTLTAPTQDLVLFSVSDSGSSNDIFLEFDNNICGSSLSGREYTGTQYKCANASQTTWAANTWYHAVYTYDTAAGGMLYVNGVLSGSNPATGRGGTAATKSAIGVGSDVLFSPFSGKIDDVRIYNRALTAAEVKQLYKLGGVDIRP